MNTAFLHQPKLHKQVFLLAFPMVISNITVPLLGLVDAAVIGHLPHVWYLGGVALGSSIISVMFWLLGFLRMATTGFTAQAWGRENKAQISQIFLQGITLAVLFAVIILASSSFLIDVILHLSDASQEVKHYAEQYFSIRIWSAPAALINLVIMGWLLGLQHAKKTMLIVIAINSLNILLDLLFVIGFDLKVQGAAAASVIADFSGMLLGIYFVKTQWNKKKLPALFSLWRQAFQDISSLLKLNRDIFLRSLCLQITFTFMTFQAAMLGDTVIAANTVLMNFLLLISFAMDGFAFAMETMVGKAVGAKNKQELLASLIVTSFWSLLIAIGFTLVFVFFGNNLIDAISNINTVRVQAYRYLPWLIALPLISMWCFLLDGVFIGATRGKEMRNSMFIAMSGFFAIWWLTSKFIFDGNHALWAAMTSFMLLRGVTLGVIFWQQWKADSFIPKI